MAVCLCVELMGVDVRRSSQSALRFTLQRFGESRFPEQNKVHLRGKPIGLMIGGTASQTRLGQRRHKSEMLEFGISCLISNLVQQR